MPIIPSKMTVKQLIERSRRRRQEILKALPPELHAEYRRLGRLIQLLQDEEKDSAHVEKVEEGFFDLPRIPLFKHKPKLIDFLRTRESATRGEIIAATGIPAGSLSSLLKGKEFEQVQHGYWGLKKGGK